MNRFRLEGEIEAAFNFYEQGAGIIIKASEG